MEEEPVVDTALCYKLWEVYPLAYLNRQCHLSVNSLTAIFRDLAVCTYLFCIMAMNICKKTCSAAFPVEKCYGQHAQRAIFRFFICSIRQCARTNALKFYDLIHSSCNCSLKKNLSNKYTFLHSVCFLSGLFFMGFFV